MKLTKTLFPFVATIVLASSFAQAQDDFAVHPYIQKPDGYVVKWYTKTSVAGELRLFLANSDSLVYNSTPEEKPELQYSEWEIDQFGSNVDTRPFFEHRVELDDFEEEIRYQVLQGSSRYTDRIRPILGVPDKTRIIFYGDSETEPESTDNFADWPDPAGTVPDRKYLVDQTDGYAANLAIMRSRHPDLVVIAGDLVESGGEQRDWDEFWRHNTNADSSLSLGGSSVILAAPGNHEYYSGPSSGGYDQPYSEMAMDKFRTYFEFPDNNSSDPKHRDRYYSFSTGAWRIIVLDVTNGLDHLSSSDTNFFLQGIGDSDGGLSPSFNAGSEQYDWLVQELDHESPAVTIVALHHVPYSSGPHGWPAGVGEGFDPQSGVPVRELMDLFLQNGVRMVIGGHDEMYERSIISYTQDDPEIGLQIYDVGIGGDGLRAPQEALINDKQRFIAHTNSPEIYESSDLKDGGKHYGHLEVDLVVPINGIYGWYYDVSPVYVFPQMENGVLQKYDRRVYPDSLHVFWVDTEDQPDLSSELSIFPNPSGGSFNLEFVTTISDRIDIQLFDQLGRQVFSDQSHFANFGKSKITLNLQDKNLPPGSYFLRARTGDGIYNNKISIQ